MKLSMARQMPPYQLADCCLPPNLHAPSLAGLFLKRVRCCFCTKFQLTGHFGGQNMYILFSSGEKHLASPVNEFPAAHNSIYLLMNCEQFERKSTEHTHICTYALIVRSFSIDYTNIYFHCADTRLKPWK